MDRISVQVLSLFLCFVWGSGENIYSAQISQNPREKQSSSETNAMYAEGESSKAELQGLIPCPDCNKRRTLLPQTSIANKINSSMWSSPVSQTDINESRIVPKQSERIEFSRKYNPEVRSNDDGFVPVPGPYGMKTRNTRTNAIKSPSVNTYKSEATPRNVKSASKSPIDKSYSPRYSQNLKRHQDVQRRSQYRVPKAHEELSVKESVANENLLGNGNFEIIRGGIYSDQDANEILGSRRMGRGFGSYVMPTYRQNRFQVVQNVHFPPYYQGRIQNPLQPLYYPRAPY